MSDNMLVVASFPKENFPKKGDRYQVGDPQWGAFVSDDEGTEVRVIIHSQHLNSLCSRIGKNYTSISQVFLSSPDRIKDEMLLCSTTIKLLINELLESPTLDVRDKVALMRTALERLEALTNIFNSLLRENQIAFRT